MARPMKPEPQVAPDDKAALLWLLEAVERNARAYLAYKRPMRRERHKAHLLIALRAAEALANVSGHISARAWRRLRDLRRMVTGESE